MTPDGRASDSTLAATHNRLAESNSLSLPGGERAPWLGRDLCSRELIARQRALVQDIKDDISQTRKIIDSTREQLDAFNILIGNSRPAAGHDSPSEADP